MKRIMVVGAAIEQLPGIIKAKQMGCIVAVVDYNPKAIGIKYADKYYNVSTIDESGLIEAAKDFRAEGILTLATDMPMRAVAAATSALGLPGITYETAIKSTDKGEMIQAFKEHDVASPWYRIIYSENELIGDANDLLYPCIMKPVDNAASRGTILVNQEKELIDAYKYSVSQSKKGIVIIEEYMRGIEVSVEILTIEEEPYVLAVTDKLTTGAPHFVELGHSQPSCLQENDIKAIKDLAIKAVQAVGIKCGPAHVEIMLTKEGPKIIELGARLGGDWITSHLVELSTGIDMIKACIQLLSGEKPNIEPKFEKGSAIRFFNTTKKGYLKEVKGLDSARRIEGIREASLIMNIGDFVDDVHSSDDRVGFIIAQSESVNDAVQLCEEAMKCIEITVE